MQTVPVSVLLLPLFLIINSGSPSCHHQAEALPLVHLRPPSTTTTTAVRSSSWWRRRNSPPRMTRWQRRCINQAGLVCTLSPTTLTITPNESDPTFTYTVSSNVSGLVTFHNTFLAARPPSTRRCYVRVLAFVRGLSVGHGGLHGFHIHSYGDIRGRDAKSAGGHFAHPSFMNVVVNENEDRKHGYPWTPKRHWGDLGNIKASMAGVAFYNKVDRVIELSKIVGRSIVIHQAMDKGPRFQPSGDAGPRVAQCVIGYRNPDLPSAL